MGRPLGPGPAAYSLPPTIGFDKHDSRMPRGPQYSFGGRNNLYSGLVKNKDGPGPGAYMVGKRTRYG